MRVTVFFYEGIDPESVLWRSLRKLYCGYPNNYTIGVNVGFGADDMDWRDAHTLAAKTSITILKAESSSVFNEMRLLIQMDEREKGISPPP